MKMWENYVAAFLGIFALWASFSPDNQCGDKTMSPGQQCTTIRMGGSSASSYTRDYSEQREQNHRERLVIGIFGGIMLLAGAAGVINGSRRENGKSDDREDTYARSQGVNSSRNGRTADPTPRNPTTKRTRDQSATNPKAKEDADALFNSIMEFFHTFGRGAKSSRRGGLDEPFRRTSAATRAPHQSATKATANERIEIEFKNVFFNRTHADRERIIAYWMRTKTVSRIDAMKLAVEDWRNAQSYH